MTNERQRLIIDDHNGLQRQLKWVFDDLDVQLATDREGGIDALRRTRPAVVLLDLGLPPDPENASEGIAALPQIMDLEPATKVIVITGNDDRDHALKAISLGAYDYFQKPVDSETLKVMVRRAMHVHALEEENRRPQPSAIELSLEGVITASPEMREVCRLIERVAVTEATILMHGETGTEKELIARSLHDLSPRSNASFTAIECAAIPEALLENELFGYEKGAFTGATKPTPGKIEIANGGTLFLDEIGDMPLPLQAKLLRFV